MLRITDATGYEIVGSIGGLAVTAQVAALRSRICALLVKIKQEEIFHMFVNPLGPDGPPDLSFGERNHTPGLHSIVRVPEYGRVAQMMGSFAELLKELAIHDRVTIKQRSLYALSEAAVLRWKSLQRSTQSGRLRTRHSDSDIEREASRRF